MKELFEHSPYARHGQLPGSLELAYLGDALYDLYVRARLVARGGRVAALHREATSIVCAHAQAEAFDRVEPMLTDDERTVSRRARNARQTPSKNADAAEYHCATALEALLGYLYVTGQFVRLTQIIERALDGAAKENPYGV
ncbi:Mini-ribonuclease 3 [Bacillota bacterium Meth-B3]|nr:ribonuclease III domain-containing protein [Christensenellaceae bacterium]MEA5066243.1 ribonuclease III domain-containing protein [Eubacteriales bacterium]MEA5068465.1 ribonuclease III domain-containing protein [Christensenellaceae bacterium]